MASFGLETILDNLENPNIQSLLKASPEVQQDLQRAKLEAFGSQKVLHPEGDASAGILVPVVSGLAGNADDGAGGVLHLGLSFCEPHVAAGIAFFGLGLASLPLVAKIHGLDEGLEVERVGIREAAGFTYSACKRTRDNLELPLSADALQERFGPLDPVGLGQELLHSEAEASRKDQCSEDEIAKLQDSVLRAKASIRRLRRRSALGFMGLSPGASAEEVSQRYKRMALEMHPDKGGDADNFQQLQDMKERLTKSIQEEEDEEERQRAEEEAKKDELPPSAKMKQLRREAHKEAVKAWEQAKDAENEMRTDKQSLKCDPAPVLARLRSYVETFSNSKCRMLPHGNKARALELLREFKSNGLELIALAALLDPSSTASLIVTHINYKVVSRSGSKEVAQAAQALLEAVADVPRRVDAFLAAIARERQAAQTEQESRAAAEEDLGGPLFPGDTVQLRPADCDQDEKQGQEEDDEEEEEEVGKRSGTVLGTEGDGVAVKLDSGRRVVLPRAQLIKTVSTPAKAKMSPDAKSGGYRNEANQEPESSGPQPVAKQAEQHLSIPSDPVRLDWDHEFTNPYVGAMSGMGDGIFCRACCRWISTRNFAHEAFLRHTRAAHKKPPHDWKGPVPED